MPKSDSNTGVRISQYIVLAAITEVTGRNSGQPRGTGMWRHDGFAKVNFMTAHLLSASALRSRNETGGRGYNETAVSYASLCGGVRDQ